eukprot:750163-Hanusia_phi.AAC.6
MRGKRYFSGVHHERLGSSSGARICEETRGGAAAMMVTERSLNTASCSLALVMMCMAVWHMQNPAHFGRKSALAQVRTSGLTSRTVVDEGKRCGGILR